MKKLYFAALLYLLLLYLRHFLDRPSREKDFSFAFRLYDDIKRIRQQIEDGTFDTFPFEKYALVQPFFRYKELFKVSPKYSLSTCQIEKTSSLLKDGIFCFLKNPSKFKAQDRNISTELYLTRLCGKEYPAKNDTIVGRSLGRIKFAVLRDPIDRFLSGYVDKCLRPGNLNTRCFACKGNLNCFVEKMYSKLLDIYTNKDNTFHFEIAHMAPQTWYCNFKEHLEEYIFILYPKCTNNSNRFAKEIDQVLQMAGVPEPLRREISKEVLSEYCDTLEISPM